MRISTFWYCLKQGIKNICRNILFSLASVATISACIFLFCLFFSIIANIRHMTYLAETTIGITVFFEEGMTEEERREWMEKQKAEGRFLFVEFLWLGLQKKAKLVEAMTTGQRVAIDIHYQDQMNTKVALDLTLYD